MDKSKVEITKIEKKEYPKNPPFNPPKIYPEYPYEDEDADENNMVYKAVRDLLMKLELDKENYGTKDWNPLGEIIKAGDNVVIKPNFVSEPRSENVGSQSIVTHASVIRPIIDYCQIALKGKGNLVIADAPQFDSDFEKIKEITKIEEVIDFVNDNSSVKVNLLDLREEVVQTEDGIIIKRFKINGDPKGYSTIDIGERSEFYHVEEYMNRIYGADYDFEETRKHHTNGKHEYYISNTILDADVVINVPKLKTHKKAGVTICLKNIIGINGNKNYLPHYRFGSKEEGGDEYLRDSFTKKFGSKFYQFIFKAMSRMEPDEMKLMIIPRKIYSFLSIKNITKHSSGNWYGNDTIWRTIVDLNKILFYVDKKGRIQDKVQRRYLAVVDGIIGGEGDGPLFPTPKLCGVILGGFNPVLVDLIAIKIMGFNWEKIPQIVGAKNVLFTSVSVDEGKVDFNLNFQFQPPPMWHGKLNDSETTEKVNRGIGMKILQICPLFPPYPQNIGSGVITVVYHLSKELVRRGHEVTVYTSAALDTQRKMDHVNNPVIVDGIEVHYFPYIMHYYTSFITPGIISYMSKNIRNFDIIHLHDSRCFQGIIVHHYAKKYGTPYVLQAHGSILPFFQKQRLKKIFDLFFGYRILGDASKVIALTKTEAEQYKKMGLDGDKIEIVPNGIYLSEYDNLPTRGEFRKKYLIGDDEKIILFLGRIHKIKGVDLLVKAFSDLIKELEDVRLVIVGPDDGFLSILKRQIDDLKVGDKILLTGPLFERDKLKAYVDADVYVLPSVYETFPITVLEACACGTPVIVTDRCGIADIVEKVGAVVGYDKDQLQDAIFKILSDGGLRRRFGEEGKRLVREEFGWSAIIKQIEKIYIDVTNEVIK